MNIKLLEEKARDIRIGAINAVHAARSGHPGGSLSSADLLAYLYFYRMRGIDPSDPENPGRDRFVLSKGHCAPGLYACLAERGFFPREELLTLRHLGSRLQGHPDMKGVPGVDMSTGSRACPPPAEWLVPRRQRARNTGFTPCSATASARRDRYGRPPCSPLITSSTTL